MIQGARNTQEKARSPGVPSGGEGGCWLRRLHACVLPSSIAPPDALSPCSHRPLNLTRACELQR